MRERIESLLRLHQADYLEIHIEDQESTHIQCQDGAVEEIRRNTERGGNVRALVKGGWGFVSFNDLDRLEEYAALAIAQARIVGNGKSILAPVAPVVDSVPLAWIKSPLTVPLPEKVRLFDEYHQAMVKSSPQVQTTFGDYNETSRALKFANSEGTWLEQEQGDVTATFIALASNDDDTLRETAQWSIGSPNDYGVIENRHQEMADTARQAEALLKAKPVKAGVYTVVVDPELAGVLIHEAFGHFSEADALYADERAAAMMALGRRLGPRNLNVVDGGARRDLRGASKYDDEGTPASKTHLIKDGILVGRLHSRETAGAMGESVTGNARATSYRFPPIVRMTSTSIEPGNLTFAEMIADIKKGIYVKGSYGGETSLDTFAFSAAEATMIRNGKLAERVQGVTLAGNVFEILANIESIGNDLVFDQSGNCNKGHQLALPVSTGSPHIRIRNVVIGS
ncbi:TldD protein [Anaerolineae bacterium]|nr:TldD protein [Anaerolineae bacterium]